MTDLHQYALARAKKAFSEAEGVECSAAGFEAALDAYLIAAGIAPVTPNTSFTFGLTARQKDLLDVIKAYTAKSNGVSPSIREMRDLMQLHTTSSIHRILVGLEERGVIRRMGDRKRTIVLTEARQ